MIGIGTRWHSFICRGFRSRPAPGLFRRSPPPQLRFWFPPRLGTLQTRLRPGQILLTHLSCRSGCTVGFFALRVIGRREDRCENISKQPPDKQSTGQVWPRPPSLLKAWKSSSSPNSQVLRGKEPIISRSAYRASFFSGSQIQVPVSLTPAVRVPNFENEYTH